MKFAFLIFVTLFLISSRASPTQESVRAERLHSVDHDFAKERYFEEFNKDSFGYPDAAHLDREIEVVSDSKGSYKDFSGDGDKRKHDSDFYGYDDGEIIPKEVRFEGQSLESADGKTGQDSEEVKSDTEKDANRVESDEELIDGLEDPETEGATLKGLSDDSHLIGDKLHGVGPMKAAGAGEEEALFEKAMKARGKGDDKTEQQDSSARELLDDDDLLEDEDDDDSDDDEYDDDEEDMDDLTMTGQAIEHDAVDGDDGDYDDEEELEDLDRSADGEWDDEDDDEDELDEDEVDQDELDEDVRTSVDDSEEYDDNEDYDGDEDDFEDGSEDVVRAQETVQKPGNVRVNGLSTTDDVVEDEEEDAVYGEEDDDWEEDEDEDDAEGGDAAKGYDGDDEEEYLDDAERVDTPDFDLGLDDIEEDEDEDELDEDEDDRVEDEEDDDLEDYDRSIDDMDTTSVDMDGEAGSDAHGDDIATRESKEEGK